jgi:hypothetical protein
MTSDLRTRIRAEAAVLRDLIGDNSSSNVPNEAADALEALQREKADLREALTQIEALKPEPFVFPPDWHEQIEACPECQSYRGHPIQQGICNTHRQPIYARERHDSFEEKAIGPRARSIARSTLSRIAGETPNDH